MVSDLLDSSDEEDDEMMDEIVLREAERLLFHSNHKTNRIKHYVESTVPGYTNLEFRQHFRMNIATYEQLEGRLLESQSLVNTSGTGRHCIHHRKQLLAVIWLLATPDSFR